MKHDTNEAAIGSSGHRHQDVLRRILLATARRGPGESQAPHRGSIPSPFADLIRTQPTNTMGRVSVTGVRYDRARLISILEEAMEVATAIRNEPSPRMASFCRHQHPPQRSQGEDDVGENTEDSIEDDNSSDEPSLSQ